MPAAEGRAMEAETSVSESETDLIPRVLARVGEDGARAAGELLPLVYDELRRLARARLARMAPGQTLGATALVHEAWIRVVGDSDPGWECRAHFFGAAAQAMRQILVEQHRRRGSLRRGGAHARAGEEALDGLGGEVPDEDLLAVDEALERLQARDPLKARIVMLRFFTGLTMPEIAELLGLPLTREEREWRFSRSWLQREIEGRAPGASA
jgi:RNA polymerase sigma factor (TIGR02999 family)